MSWLNSTFSKYALEKYESESMVSYELLSKQTAEAKSNSNSNRQKNNVLQFPTFWISVQFIMFPECKKGVYPAHDHEYIFKLIILIIH